MIDRKNSIKGGLFGLLVGDALGVPYEFHCANDIPSSEQIEMEPPLGFERAHEGVKPGTWSDDGAQALCLLESLVESGQFDLKHFSDKLLLWYEEGLWAVDHDVFDVGVQTAEALWAYASGMAADKCGFIAPEGKGNGALMRVLPLALWHKGTDEALVLDAHEQCLITHGNMTNQICCALYCLVARNLLAGRAFEEALMIAIHRIREIYSLNSGYLEEFEWRLRPDETDSWIGKGGGYVIDSLRSAFMIMKQATSYEEAVKGAIALGDDTDTTACITGGLAGIMFGYDNIPVRWMKALRNRKDVEAFLKKYSEDLF